MAKQEVDRKLDVLMKLYEVNFNYQAQKEQMVWFGSTLYFSFSIGAIVWLFANPGMFQGCCRKVGFDILLLFLSALPFWFVLNQNWNKSWAVQRNYFLSDRLAKFDLDYKPSYQRIVLAAYPDKKPSLCDKWHLSWKYGLAGMILLILMLALFLVVGSIPWILPYLHHHR
jgi:hypothetical protein